ncbi:bifunctional DNA primase/polymerase [Streptomyces sp. NPDC020799]|uniref:bifunctional DNA primase/polymerase n=1 Tax=Streptomyces sp. NPDC020799 TaxID=3365091 RepID=UPI0037BE1C1A
MPQAVVSTQHSAALQAASRGWRVFPLVSGAKYPAVRDWEERATTDSERINRCWSSGPYNIGIATGPSHLVVIDLDTPKTPEDTPPADWAEPGITDGADVLAALCERHGRRYPCETYAVRTRSGGTHLYFTAPGGTELHNTRGKLGWKIDTRAVGGLVVAAGSAVEGRWYTVMHDAAPEPLPQWLADLLRPAPLPPQKPVKVALTSDRRGSYLRAAVNAELERVTSSPPDGHNNALYLASVALGQLVAGRELGEAEVTEWLTAAALPVGQSEREARRTIASGLRAGARRPRTVAA